jgi:hypothetical protein
MNLNLRSYWAIVLALASVFALEGSQTFTGTAAAIVPAQPGQPRLVVFEIFSSPG